MRKVLAALGVGSMLAVAAACERPPGPATPEGVPVVVATTPVLAELVEMVVGQGAEVRSLVPLGADPHEYRFSEFDVDMAADAELVVANGGGLEPDLSRLTHHLAEGGFMFVAVSQLDAPVTGDEGETDPHFWHDPLATVDVVEALAERLGRVDPDGASGYERRAREAVRVLGRLRQGMTEILHSVPEQRRALVTQHDFFGYFARRFDFAILGTVVAGTSSLDPPPGRSREALIEEMDAHGVCVVFTPSTSTEALSALVAEEAEHDVTVVEVLADSLAGDVQTYVEAMRQNARAVARALTECG